MLLLAVACVRPPYGESAAATAPPADHYRIVGGSVVGRGPAEIEVDAGYIVAVGEVGSTPAGLVTVDATGRWIAPGFIDSHVHLAYRPDAEGLVAGGIAGVVDLAAPADTLDDPWILPSRRSGPMITVPGGYPTRGWGSGGYGLEVADVAAAEAAVDTLVDAGATVVKVPIREDPELSGEQLAAIVARAHARGVKVAAHALSDRAVASAAAAGVDVLAHTPPGALSEATLEAWRGRAVVSTVSAFGGAGTLAQLRAHGATVLYGTDFGNTGARGISAAEVRGLVAAGLDPAAVLAAGTTTPAAFWGFDELGAVEVGHEARLVFLDADPLVDPGAWSR